MLIIGLTGGIACGKSMVSQYFEKLGIPIIDTDIISKQLVEPGQAALTEILNIFGRDVVDSNNQLDRKKLREIIFNSLQKRQQLEAILHPKIHTKVMEILKSIDKNKEIPYCIVVVPLLFETKSSYPIDRILLVDCTEQQQIERLMSRDNITREQSLAIVKIQTPRSKRQEKADEIIENETDQKSCYLQVKKIHDKYLTFSK